MKRFSRRTWILLVGVVVAAAAAIGGYAYFTTTATGSGTATVASASMQFQNVAVGPNIYPEPAFSGSGIVPVIFDLHNNSSSSVFVSKVDLASIVQNGTGFVLDTIGDGSCHTGDFYFRDPSGTNAYVLVNHTFTPGETVTGYSGKLWLYDTNINQDACQGLGLYVTLKINNS